MKRKNKKKLPGYALGTRMPATLGYQPAKTGTGLFASVKGEDINPETKAVRQSTIPNALNKLQSSISPVLQTFQKQNMPTTIANAVANTAAMNFGSTVGSTGVNSVDSVVSNINAIGRGGAAKAVGSSAIGTAGTVAGALGTLYGLTDMGFQIANAGSHRTAADMANTRSTNTYTTPGGTQYTQMGGVDTKAELEYERANTRNKLFNFGASAIGTGAAAGATIGALAGSSVPLVGTAIGAGVGTLLGVGAGLLGFGDNEEEVLALAKRLDDITAMGNRLRKSDAEDQDVYNSFYGKSNDGTLGASYGKRPVWSPMGLINAKTTAKVSSGELIGNFRDGYVTRVEGTPNNKDTKRANLRPDDFVISNKYGLSDLAAITGDYAGTLMLQDMLMKQNKNYKNGKLPKFAGGFGEYATMLAPHLALLYTAWSQYNRDRNASTYVPKIEADYSDAIKSAYRMRGDQISKTPYYNLLNKLTRQALWNTRRNPGAGYGGRLMLENSLNRQMLDQYAKTSLDIDLQNQAQRNKAESALQSILGHSTDINNQNMGAWIAMTQQANAAKENAMRQSLYNTTMPFMNGVADYFRRYDTNRAADIQNRELDLYDRQVGLEWKKYYNSLNNQSASAPVSSQYKLSAPDLAGFTKPKAYLYFNAPELTKPTEYKRIHGLGWRPYFSLPASSYFQPKIY